MTAERWQRVNELFHAAIGRNADERPAFLAEACSGDDAVLREVERLVASHERAEGFIPGSASAHALHLLADDERRMVGRVLGRYRIAARVGVGGMGEVYRARDEQLHREVAIKVLPALTTGDAAARARLVREARAAAALNHPHICTIHEAGEADGQVYIAMEYLEGRTLSEEIERGDLTLAAALRYGAQIAGALAHAHARGIVHRDLKCSNVVITADGRAKVLDFGLARRVTGEEVTESAAQWLTMTQPGLPPGTPAYMAPEQLRGQEAYVRSDVWALGVVLHEMAAGERPFQGQTDHELIAAITNQSPRPLPARVPAELRAVVERCLEKEPGQRYQSAADVCAALEAIASGAAPRRGRVPRWSVLRAARPVRLAVGVALVAIVALLSFNIRGLWQRLSGATAPRIESIADAIEDSSPARATTVGMDVGSIAVLPFANLSASAENEYFSDGIADEIVTTLANIGELRVIGRTSTRQYSGTAKPTRQIAAELGVRHLLAGSVQRVGDRVRINAQLVDAAADAHLWAERYDRPLEDIFAVQSEIAQEIARALRVSLSAGERARLERRPTSNPIAHDYVLRARNLL